MGIESLLDNRNNGMCIKDPVVIAGLFDWDDETTYKWSIFGEDKSILLFIGAMILVPTVIPCISAFFTLLVVDGGRILRRGGDVAAV